MDDRLALEGALVPRRSLPLVRARPDTLRQRFHADNERFKLAVQRLRVSVSEATPAARIRSRPIAWIAGGFATGLVLGWLVSGRPR